MTNLEDDFPHKDFLREAGKVLVIWGEDTSWFGASHKFSVHCGSWHLGDILLGPSYIAPVISIWGKTSHGVWPVEDSVRLLIRMWGGDSKLQIDFIDRGK